ncbi:uncharacterized protein [Apostichopus japonicus]
MHFANIDDSIHQAHQLDVKEEESDCEEEGESYTFHLSIKVKDELNNGETLSEDSEHDAELQDNILPESQSEELSNQPDERTARQPQGKHALDPTASYSNRPGRRCPYCEKSIAGSQLTRHLKARHKDVEEVSFALQQPPKIQRRLFRNLMKSGLHALNREELTQGLSAISRVRNQGNSSTVICSKCKGSYSQSNFRRHKNQCDNEKKDSLPPQGVPPSYLSMFDEDDSFASNILLRVKKDDVGKLCLSDPSILTIGKFLWSEKRNKIDKLIEGRKSVMKAMRQLALLFLRFKEKMIQSGKETDSISAGDMFDRGNFRELESSVTAITQWEDGSLKYGLKKELKYLVKKAAQILHSNYLILGEDKKAKDIDLFTSVFDRRQHGIFSDVEDHMRKNRQGKQRKPLQQHPEEEDVLKIRQYTLNEIKRISNGGSVQTWSSQLFCSLRNLVVSRLTLYNARRNCGEPCRLNLAEWREAAEGSRIEASRDVNKINDPVEKLLLETSRIAYQSGKATNTRLVSVLIPKDCVQALEFLVDPKVRSACGVHSRNNYVFPATQSSLDHTSGWQCVHTVSLAAKVKCPSKLTATPLRHQTSTMYAMLDVPADERERFYEDINKHVYQAPPAVSTITTVGKDLFCFDKENRSDQAGPSGCTSESTDEGPSDSVHMGPETSAVSDAETDDSDSSDQELVDLHVPKKSDPRKRHKWSDQNTSLVKNCFKKYIQEKAEGNKGSLPALEPTASYSKRPGRRCPYCEKSIAGSQLTRHLKARHKDVEEVSFALQQPPKIQRQLFRNLMKSGLHALNREELTQGLSAISRVRNQGNSSTVICSKCKGSYSQSNFRKHKNQCDNEKKNSLPPQGVPPSYLSMFDEDDSFASNILLRVKKDDVGKLCLSDPSILTIGKFLWSEKQNNIDKLIEGRESVMKAMRRLALLFLRFKEQMIQSGKETDSISTGDMFDRGNFRELESSVTAITQLEVGLLKYVLKNEVKYLVKKAAQILHSNYLILGEDGKAKDIDLFTSVFDRRQHGIPSDVEDHMRKNRQGKQRRPLQQHPEEEDVLKIRQYTLNEIKRISNGGSVQTWSSQLFCSLRNLVVSRLTLYNARRNCGEPCRLNLAEWREAAEGSRIEASRDVDKINDPFEKFLLETSRIAYQSGKGTNTRLVSVLIPKDCVQALEFLVDPKVRSACGVHSRNNYVFPYTQSSLDHTSGWQCVHAVSLAAKVKCPSKLTATPLRHQTSTMYAMLDVPASERERFYEHMGHSEDINKHVYQAPPAVSTITTVGKQLFCFDKENRSDQAGPSGCPRESTDEGPSGSVHMEPETSAVSDAETDDSNSSNQELEDLYDPNKSDPRKRHKWSDQNTSLVKNCFKKYIQEKEEGNKGSLPGKKELMEFLHKEKDVLSSIKSADRRIFLLKMKIFNERKCFRLKLGKKLLQIQK